MFKSTGKGIRMSLSSFYVVWGIPWRKKVAKMHAQDLDLATATCRMQPEGKVEVLEIDAGTESMCGRFTKLSIENRDHK